MIIVVLGFFWSPMSLYPWDVNLLVTLQNHTIFVPL